MYSEAGAQAEPCSLFRNAARPERVFCVVGFVACWRYTCQTERTENNNNMQRLLQRAHTGQGIHTCVQQWYWQSFSLVCLRRARAVGFIQLPVLRGKHAELAHQAGLARSNNDACVRARCVRVALLPSNTSFRSMCLFVDTLPLILPRPGKSFLAHPFGGYVLR